MPIWLFHTANGISPVPSDSIISQTKSGFPPFEVTALTSDFLTTLALKDTPLNPRRKSPIALTVFASNLYELGRSSPFGKLENPSGSLMSFRMSHFECSLGLMVFL